MRKLFSFLVLLLSMMTAMAASDGINAIRFEGPSGNKCTVLLEEQPVITFSDDYLVVTTHMGGVSFPSSAVTKYTYVHEDDPTRINNAGQYGSVFSFQGKRLHVTNLAPTTAVHVYTADGALVSSATTDSRGNVSLSLPEPSGAVYLVKTSTVTFKIRKP